MRVAYGSARGDLRWRGQLPEVDGGKYTWVGVEWDPGPDADKHGRHDGTFRGKRYFSCERTPARASFVRADQVHFPQSLGYLLDAYQKPGTQTQPGDVPGSTEQPAAGVAPLVSACLARSCVVWNPAESALVAERHGKSVRYLDISFGLIEYYEDIAEILQTFPRLEELDISGNRLRPRNSTTISPNHALSSIAWVSQSLRILRWNCAGVETSIAALAQLVLGCTVLEELRLHGNHIRLEVRSTNTTILPRSLTRLYLGANHLECVACLPSPELELLDLSENPALDRLGAPASSTECFAPRLSSLNLTDTSFVCLEFLADPNHFPQLRNLRLRHLPRDHIIARMPYLEKLNGSEITAAERREAELRFLADWSTAAQDAFASSPLKRRVEALCRQYGVKAEAPLPPPSPLPHMERGYVPVVLGQLRMDAPVPTRIPLASLSQCQQQQQQQQLLLQVPASTPWWLAERIAFTQLSGIRNQLVSPPSDDRHHVVVHLAYATAHELALQPQPDWLTTLEELDSAGKSPVYVLVHIERNKSHVKCCDSKSAASAADGLDANAPATETPSQSVPLES